MEDVEKFGDEEVMKEYIRDAEKASMKDLRRERKKEYRKELEK